jgi:hypothetical protein
MIMRVTILVASLLASAPAIAEPMGPEVAQRFVTGKLFAFNCVDGTRGLGQIYTDGSAMATIQVSGSGPTRTLGFPPGTLKVKPYAPLSKACHLSRVSISTGPASRAFADRLQG